MKRDIDLVRSILIYVENAADEVDADEMATERWPIETVAYHVRLMAHHGLVDVSRDARDMNGNTIELTVAGITWDGQDYLDSIREPKVWGRVKKALAGTVGSTTLDIVRQTASMVALAMVREGLGI
ncbi:MAG: DUF2513 domain-containing protein [Senegalimassilia anaerobia]|uniref:DUF2513 domain-containing protein n=1 Tax=Senegalimassilia anaerobia TaxID=1473216 RepID=UPI002E770831|nr:DUF2513 domain-containing protein [Senegalimassilia anaerobia]MEE0303461.1 DUF2513 domain-containing protein [Senegalimassilia anaerobia]